MEGSGRMLVTAVGKNSQAGIIYSLLNNMHDDLPEATVQLNSLNNPKGEKTTVTSLSKLGSGFQPLPDIAVLRG